jgi:hypothetical protein
LTESKQQIAVNSGTVTIVVFHHSKDEEGFQWLISGTVDRKDPGMKTTIAFFSTEQHAFTGINVGLAASLLCFHFEFIIHTCVWLILETNELTA